jgi:hypothetical protein
MTNEEMRDNVLDSKLLAKRITKILKETDESAKFSHNQLLSIIIEDFGYEVNSGEITTLFSKNVKGKNKFSFAIPFYLAKVVSGQTAPNVLKGIDLYLKEVLKEYNEIRYFTA